METIAYTYNPETAPNWAALGLPEARPEALGRQAEREALLNLLAAQTAVEAVAGQDAQQRARLGTAAGWLAVGTGNLAARFGNDFGDSATDVLRHLAN